MDTTYILDRIKRVVSSCETFDQFNIAKIYCTMLINKKYNFDGLATKGYYDMRDKKGKNGIWTLEFGASGAKIGAPTHEI